MELWDAYNADYEKIEGAVLVRGEDDTFPEGMYHLVCEVLVRHVDGTYLLMKRDPTKPLFPNAWEATAGGSALQGETDVEGALRELREETGIVADKLKFLDKSLGTHCWHVRFLCITDCDKNSITLQEGETSDFKWVSADEVLAMTESELVGWQMKKFISSPKVYMTCGKICSGKTTYAQKLRQKNKAVVLSIDEIMLSMFAQDAGDKHDYYVEKLKEYLFKKSLEIIESGINVVLDWGFWTKTERNYARKFYADHKVACEFHFIEVDDEEWKKRIEKRNLSVGHNEGAAYYVDEGLAQKFVEIFEKPEPSEIDVWVK